MFVVKHATVACPDWSFAMTVLNLVESYILGEAARWKREGVKIEKPEETVESYIGKPGHYISFTGLPKLGINPQSKFKTPLAIYTYALDDPWFARTWATHKETAKGFPFRPEQPYIQIMKLKSLNGLVVFDRSGAIIHGANLIDAALKAIEGDDWADAVALARDESKRWMSDFGSESLKVQRVWAVTRAKAMIDTQGGGSEIARWGKILMSLGIMAVEDRGAGMIHENEPHQAAILSMAAVDRIAQVENPLPEAISVKPVRGSGKFKREFKQHYQDYIDIINKFRALGDVTSVTSIDTALEYMLRDKPLYIRQKDLEKWDARVVVLNELYDYITKDEINRSFFTPNGKGRVMGKISYELRGSVGELAIGGMLVSRALQVTVPSLFFDNTGLFSKTTQARLPSVGVSNTVKFNIPEIVFKNEVISKASFPDLNLRTEPGRGSTSLALFSNCRLSSNQVTPDDVKRFNDLISRGAMNSSDADDLNSAVMRCFNGLFKRESRPVVTIGKSVRFVEY